MLENVTILARAQNKPDLVIMEAFYIKEHNPTIYTQAKDLNIIHNFFHCNFLYATFVIVVATI